MGALLILILAALYLWVSYKVVRRARSVWGKVLAVLAFILIPTADAVYGRIKLRQMCEAEGGVRIYRTVENVNGFYASRFAHEFWIIGHHYQYVEGDDAGQPFRISRNEKGNIVTEKNVANLKSTYVFEHEVVNQKTFLWQREIVKVRRTQEVLGTAVDIAYYGGWVERALSALYAGRWSAGHCEMDHSGNQLIDLVTTVLKPNNQPK